MFIVVSPHYSSLPTELFISIVHQNGTTVMDGTDATVIIIEDTPALVCDNVNL
jgi:hypothetical protein